jgi:hypothetical protein
MGHCQHGYTLKRTGVASLLVLVLERTASLTRTRRVKRFFVPVNVLNDAVFIDDEGGPVGETVFLIQDSVLLRDGPLEITQQREGEAILLGKNLVGRRTINADAENLRAGLLEFGDISLIRLQLCRSTPGESEDVKGQHYILLAEKIA